jgi:alanyl-tRNA synthetase
MNKTTRTEKLYLNDPYTASFQASVLSCAADDQGRQVAVLDRTCFYPESGGQPSDRGTIGGVRVLDVWEDDSGGVFHQVEGPISPGPAECRVDWGRRFDHMQQHTGQHILSRAFIEVAGLETVSFHLGEETCTIDLDGGAVSDDIAARAEELANSVVWENREVRVIVRSPDDMADGELRKAVPDGVEEIRLVEVADFDTCGCCGTHVRCAGELGMIKVLKSEKAKGANRVYFVVGKRAFADFVKKHDITRRLANRFTTAVESVEDKIEKLNAEHQRLRKDSQKTAKKLAEFEAARLHAGSERVGNRAFIVEVVSDASEEYLRLLASNLKSYDETISLLGTREGLVICNASKDIDIDLAAPVVERAKALGGSGGGKGGFATARLPGGVSTEEFLKEILGDVKGA